MLSIDQITECYAKDVRPVSVRCSACNHSFRFRAFPEVLDCLKLGKMKNAEELRQCDEYEPK